MRILLAFICVFAATQAIASQATSVEGVRIFGDQKAVSASDIREAIAAFKYSMQQAPGSLDIVSHDEIHGYLKLHDLGWFTMKRDVFVDPDSHKKIGWDVYGQGIRDFPQALHCIRTAHKVYIFPIVEPLKPHIDKKHLRLITGYARSILIDMLGYKVDWFSGFDDTSVSIGKEPRNVGFIFRNGEDELVLFFSPGGRAQGTFNGQNVSGTLGELSPAKKMQYWKRDYAQPELGSHKGNSKLHGSVIPQQQTPRNRHQ